MALIIIFMLLTGLIILFLLKKNKNKHIQLSSDKLEVNALKDQINEIDTDLNYGLIREEEAKDSYKEINENIASVINSEKTSEEKKIPKLLLFSLVVLLPLLSIITYSFNGKDYWLKKYSEFLFEKNYDEVDKEKVKIILKMVKGLEKKLKIDSENLEGWKKLGRSKLVLGDIEGAKNAYMEAKKLEPNDIEVLEGEANIAFIVNDGKIASKDIELFKKILSLDDKNIMALLVLGEYEDKQGNILESINIYEKLLSLLPKGIDEVKAIKLRILNLKKRN